MLVNSTYNVPNCVNIREYVLNNVDLTVLNNALAFLSYCRDLLFYNLKFKKNWPYKTSVRIKFDWFAQFLPNGMDLTKAINFLEKEGWMIVHRNYKVGVCTHRYQLAPKIMESEWSRLSFEDLFPRNLVMRETVSKSGRKVRYAAVRSRPLDKIYKYLSGPDRFKKAGLLWLYEAIKTDFSYLTIDDSDHFIPSYVRSRAESDFADYEKARDSAEKKSKRRKSPIPNKHPIFSLDNFIHSRIFPVNAIKENKFTINLDKENGRIYTPITMLDKTLRERVRWKGRELVNVDVKTCQPALLSTFYCQSQDSVKEEKDEFIRLVTQGDFYEELGRAAGIKDRNKAKSQAMLLMFGKRRHQQCPIAQSFQERFPQLSILIEAIRKGRYKDVALMMQKAESDIMIRGVLCEFKSKYPDRPAFSIHDSFLVLPEDVDIIQEMIIFHFENKVGFKPQVRVDN